MANNQYVNKVIFGNDTLIDLSSDTVAANKMLSGTTAHDKSGATITGNIPIQTSVFSGWVNQAHRYVVSVEKGYYDHSLGIGMLGIKIPIPDSGTNSFYVHVPNGTLTPDENNSEDWIEIGIEVDSNGNSNITDDTIPATGVSF